MIHSDKPRIYVAIKRTCISLPRQCQSLTLQITILCTYLIPPGATVTSATEIPVEILNVVESAIRTDPPAYVVAGVCESGNVYDSGTCP